MGLLNNVSKPERDGVSGDTLLRRYGVEEKSSWFRPKLPGPLEVVFDYSYWTLQGILSRRLVSKGWNPKRDEPRVLLGGVLSLCNKILRKSKGNRGPSLGVANVI